VSGVITLITKARTAVYAVLVGAVVGVHPSHATNMTAGVVLEKMDAKELFAYVYGIVDGMAYARFRKDSLVAGSKQEAGMKCIYDWFFEGETDTFVKVEAAFRQNAQHVPPVIIATMIKIECGE